MCVCVCTGEGASLIFKDHGAQDSYSACRYAGRLLRCVVTTVYGSKFD